MINGQNLPPAWLEEHPLFGRVLGQLQLSPSPRVRAIVRGLVRDAFVPLGPALAARLPAGLDPVRGICRLSFVLGVRGFVATGFEDMRRSVRRRLGPRAVLDTRIVVDEVVGFCAAGMRAPGAEEQR